MDARNSHTIRENGYSSGMLSSCMILGVPRGEYGVDFVSRSCRVIKTSASAFSARIWPVIVTYHRPILIWPFCLSVVNTLHSIYSLVHQIDLIWSPRCSGLCHLLYLPELNRRCHCQYTSTADIQTRCFNGPPIAVLARATQQYGLLVHVLETRYFRCQPPT